MSRNPIASLHVRCKMPHAGLMNEQQLGPVEGPLQRARLHIRGGKRRLRQGKTAAGIAALADALSGALQWYFASPERSGELTIDAGADLNDDRTLYGILLRSGVLDGRFDFDAFDRLTEEALRRELTGFDYRGVLEGLEAVMTQLGVMPFDEASLPPEDPATY
jgi:hypothetical protein